jgi:hypothetical protein
MEAFLLNADFVVSCLVYISVKKTTDLSLVGTKMQLPPILENHNET